MSEIKFRPYFSLNWSGKGAIHNFKKLRNFSSHLIAKIDKDLYLLIDILGNQNKDTDFIMILA